MRSISRRARADELTKIAKENGADLIGFADMRRLRGLFEYTDRLIDRYPYGISLTVALDRWGRYDASTENDYSFPFLEHIARQVKKGIEDMGFSARIIMPDKRVSEKNQLYWNGEVSHKAAAKTAGIGWIGKSTLLVTPEYGPRVCLATVLTDMPLPAATPMKNKCGSCRMCVGACPLGALKGPSFADHPRDVNEAIDIKKCGALVNPEWEDGSLCYECMLACPKGTKRKKGRLKRV
jgi:ferredoxin